MYTLFTSESVSEGHPDKIADQISDHILDKIIEQDIYSHVACETFITKGIVLVGGELKTTSNIDVEEIVRKILKKIGYKEDKIGFNGNSCAIINVMGKQSKDITDSIKTLKPKIKNAGDQGSVFGYAVKETKQLMPAPITYAHKLIERHYDIRKTEKVDWLFPDAKSQVTFKYEKARPVGIDSIVFSTHHDINVKRSTIVDFVMEEIIKKSIPNSLLNVNTKFYINQSGRFCIGGPVGDCGLTGRKIMVDTYGGYSRHGGGAFSGKDPTKIDRSAAYMARYLSKNIVASNIAQKCEIQISYVIGKTDPISLSVNTFNTSNIDDEKISSFIKTNFDLTPSGIINFLDLLKPIYTATSFHGHFGREKESFSWEKTDKKELFLDI